MASKTRHAAQWRGLRAAGVPIICTWIDEAGGAPRDGWPPVLVRCIREAAAARALVLYAEPDEVLKDALVEAGAALAAGVPVFTVGVDRSFSFLHHPLVHGCESLDDALIQARVLASECGDR